jgi:hypothetical protein
VTVAIPVVPAVTIVVTHPRPADYRAGGAADDCADRAGDDCARGSTDGRTGYRSFSTIGGLSRIGQGGERRDCGGEKKFAHRILHKFNLQENAQTRAKFIASTNRSD